MEFYEKDFGKILKANALKQRRMMLQYGTDCMRVYDRNLEQFPVTVDLYGKYARITDYSVDGMEEAMRETCCDIVSRMLYVQSDHVVFYHREKRIGREQHETLSEVSVKTLVKENGLTFTVDLTRHIDTGLFLDHAVTREWVRENCQGLSVLNLFSYTGAFSVYAAAGGAASVVSVDLSGPYTQWAKENLKANGFEGDLYPCVQMDALRFVERELAKGSKYQVIVFDPPTFSNSHKMDGDFDVARDYSLWVKNLLKILKKTGIILFSTNLGSFQMDRRRLRGLSVKEITGLVAAPGFVKDRAGTVRSWMMAFDDDSLSLDWSEPEKKSVKSSDSSERKERSDRPYSRDSRGPRDHERRTYGRRDDRRGFDRGERDGERPYRRERREDRPYSDRGDRYDRKQYGRSYDREDRPERTERRSYRSDREEGERRSERPYGRSYDRPRSFDRSERPARSRRNFDEKRSYQGSENPEERRPYRERRERSFDRDAAPRERRSFDNKWIFCIMGKNDRGEQNERTFGR